MGGNSQLVRGDGGAFAGGAVGVVSEHRFQCSSTPAGIPFPIECPWGVGFWGTSRNGGHIFPKRAALRADPATGLRDVVSDKEHPVALTLFGGVRGGRSLAPVDHLPTSP